MFYVNSDGSDSEEFITSKSPKIYKLNLHDGKYQFICGASGNCSITQAFESIDFSKMKITKKDRADPTAFLRDKFIPFMRDRMPKVQNDKDEEFEFVIGIFGKLYTLDHEYTLLEAPSQGTAIGSAASPAKAALYAISKLDKKTNPLRIIRIALETSESINHYCKPPFLYLEL